MGNSTSARFFVGSVAGFRGVYSTEKGAIRSGSSAVLAGFYVPDTLTLVSEVVVIPSALHAIILRFRLPDLEFGPVKIPISFRAERETDLDEPRASIVRVSVCPEFTPTPG